ncbi:MAG: VOC family protein [Hyphomicrobiales bacterium]
MARGVDHLVLPVPSLDVARQRYEALGFTVNKDGIHPFGTSNCCVFIENGVYLEPLAVHDEAVIAEKISQNSFVGLDSKYRALIGDNGLSAISIQSNDAEADIKHFTGPYENGPSTLKFSRKAIHPDGTEDTLSVDGAFCLNPDFPALSLFTCQWQGDPSVISKIKTAPKHANTVVATIGVELSSNDMPNALAYLGHAFGADFTRQDDDSYDFAAPNCHIKLIKGDQPLHAVAVTFSVTSLEAVGTCLEKSKIAYDSSGDTIKVAAALGQGVTMQFTERTSLT